MKRSCVHTYIHICRGVSRGAHGEVAHKPKRRCFVDVPCAGRSRHPPFQPNTTRHHNTGGKQAGKQPVARPGKREHYIAIAITITTKFTSKNAEDVKAGDERAGILCALQ